MRVINHLEAVRREIAELAGQIVALQTRRAELIIRSDAMESEIAMLRSTKLDSSQLPETSRIRILAALQAALNSEILSRRAMLGTFSMQHTQAGQELIDLDLQILNLRNKEMRFSALVRRLKATASMQLAAVVILQNNLKERIARNAQNEAGTDSAGPESSDRGGADHLPAAASA